VAGPAILKIDIIADATKALKGLGMVEDKASGTGSKLTGLGKGIVAAVGTGAILKFGTDSFKAAEESAVATARLEQVFSSMGDTTGEAARAAEDYASALSAKIAVDDEAIMAAQAQLATFGKVSDETARSAGIFDRATAAAADLAAAGFGSLDANSVQLGKALQDPVKGLAALGKSGVTFTKAQKDQIAAMVEANDTLGAQKIVLQAVESQVGGTAAKTATSTAKMSIKFGELQETIGSKLLPVVNSVVEVFTKYMGLIIPLGAAILGVVVAVKAYQAATTAVKVAQEAWNVVQVAFNVIMSANPIMLVVIAIAALVAAVVLAYMKVGWFRDAVDKAFRAVATAFGFVTTAAKKVFDWLKQNWPLILAVLTGPFGLAALAIVRNWDSIKAGATAMFEWVKGKFDALVGAIQDVLGVLSGVMASIVDVIKMPIAAAGEMFSAVKGKFDELIGFLGGLVSRVAGPIGRVVSAMKNPINAFIRAWNQIELKIPSVDIPLVGKVGGSTIGLPTIPQLARGGFVARTGLALVHEGERFSGVGRGGWGSTTIHVHVTTTGLGADSPEIQRAVVNALRGYASRNGALDVPIRRT